MKKILIVFAFLQGCAIPYSYYQLVDIETKGAKTTDNHISYGSEDIVVYYNFWSNGGNTNFSIFNNTDSNITVDMRLSHLIVNQVAYAYFNNSTTVNSSSVGLSVGMSSAYSYLSGNTQKTPYNSYVSNYGGSSFSAGLIGSQNASNTTIAHQAEQVVIPPKSFKMFPGIHVTGNVFKSCDLKQRIDKEPVALTYTDSTSPMSCRNYITYKVGNSENKVIENTFWINRITNYNNKNFTGQTKVGECGKQLNYPKEYFLFQRPYSYYMPYSVQPYEK